MINLSQITFIRENRTILDNVSLHMNRGEHWVLLGRNGSGKTTILEMMTGYQFPSSGRVEVLGNVYGECDVREVRKQIGYIGPSMLDKLSLADPVWEVVATGEYAFLRFYQQIPEEVRMKAIGLLEKLDISHLMDQKLVTLSQGERKKVLLARSLMANPEVLIMDEPCVGLDLFERERLLESIRAISEDVLIVYVTHHIEEIIPLFTHVAIIEEGRVIVAGPKQEVLTPEHVYRAFRVPITIEWSADRPWIKVLQNHD
jgi:iron complex transport system ATP-binding protein